MTGVADNLVAGFNDIFRRQSPSRVFMDMGRDLMEGLRIGIEGNLSGPLRQMETLADSLAGPTICGPSCPKCSAIASQRG